MKLKLSSFRRQRGSVLVTTLVIALLVGLLVAALLFVAQQQNYMTARSRVWCSEIPIAEAGIEEAISHIISLPANMTDNGWQASGTNYVKTRNFSNAYFYTTIIPNSSATNTIISVGFARVPLQTNYTQRTVMARLKRTVNDWGFVAKQTITMSGTTYADSYNSNYGDWDYFLNRRDNCGMATISSLTPAIITGSGKIYGSAATGPGGTVTGNVGDGLWHLLGGGLQPGHVSDDFNMAITDVELPKPWAPSYTPTKNVTVDGVTYEHVLNGGDWQFDGDTSPASSGWLIQGNVRIFFNGNFKMTAGGASIRLATNSTLEIYMGGEMDVQGTCVVNPAGRPNNCAIYGLPACKSIVYKGDSAAFARIYAPQAYVEIAGTSDFFGSVVADTLKFSGTCALHYDEALNNGIPQFRVISWEEL
jgi:Tfp pilus assembly protein PilX